ncbi:MAG: hypothetical protein ACUVXA_03645 [Candidatus Jordarchaeum sp.]
MGVKRMDDITHFLEDREIRKALEKIVRYEEKKRKEYKTDPIWRGMRDLKPYWSWQDVGVHWSIVHKLLSADIIKA